MKNITPEVLEHRKAELNRLIDVIHQYYGEPVSQEQMRHYMTTGSFGGFKAAEPAKDKRKNEKK